MQSTKSMRGGDWFLLLMPLVVLIVPQGTIQRTLVPELIFTMFLVVSAISIILRWSLLGKFSLPRSSLNLPLLLFLLYFLVLNPILSALSGNTPLNIFLTAVPFSMLAVFYLIAMQHLGVFKTKRLLLAFGFSGVIVSVVVIGNYFFGDLTAFDMRSTAIEGRQTLTLPLLPMAGVFFISLTLASRGRTQTLLYGFFAAICFVAVMMTVARAMLLAYVIAISFVVWQLASRGIDAGQGRRMTWAITVLVFAFIGLAFPFIGAWLGRIDFASEGNVVTILGRFDEYMAFWKGFVDSPLFGRGLGHSFIYPSLFDDMLSYVGITVCHNHFFFFAGTTGLVGLALYYTVLISGFVEHVKLARRDSLNREAQGYVVGSLGAAMAGVLFTLSSTTFTTLSYNLFLAFFLHVARIDWRDDR